MIKSIYDNKLANLVLGLFDPSKFGLSTWCGYQIATDTLKGLKGLNNYGRFLYVLANRDGEMGGICPLFFDGSVTYFEELPKPDEQMKIMDYYDKVSNLKSYRQQSKFNQLKSAALTFYIKHFKNRK